MAQGRILLSSISESKKIASLNSDSERLLYSWLIAHLDYNGNFYGDAKTVQSRVFTRLKHSVSRVSKFLNALEDKKLIYRYRVNGETLLHVIYFTKKTPGLRPDKEKVTTLPKPNIEDIKKFIGNDFEIEEEIVEEGKLKELLTSLNSSLGKKTGDHLKQFKLYISEKLKAGQSTSILKRTINKQDKLSDKDRVSLLDFIDEHKRTLES